VYQLILFYVETDTISCINWYYFVYQPILFCVSTDIIFVSIDNTMLSDNMFQFFFLENFTHSEEAVPYLHALLLNYYFLLDKHLFKFSLYLIFYLCERFGSYKPSLAS
jgi:hypothetical protein